MTNIWPDFAVDDVADSPKQIVEEAGAGLRERTGNKINFQYEGISIDGGKATARYGLFVPSLSYFYPFARLTFSLKDSYPAELITTDGGRPLIANSKEELLDVLQETFRSEATVNIVRQLLSIVK